MLCERLQAKERNIEAVPGLTSIAVIVSRPTDIERARALLQAIRRPDASGEAPPDDRDPLLISVRYGGEDGPDLPALAEAAGMSENAWIEAHGGALHHVEILGFTPGFAYMSGLPEDLQMPRKPSPRARVPAGSVAVTEAFTGIYPLEGPGGWNIIGRTDLNLFDPDRLDPFLITPGRKVRFVPS